MNERIKELAEQAQKVVGYTDGGYTEIKALDPEMFAELIIEECTQLLFDESERLYSYSSECNIMRDSEEAELCAEKCMDNIAMIEEHFGVE